MAFSDSSATEPVSLSISCVTFNTNQDHLKEMLASLASACSFAKAQGLLSVTQLYLIDNGPTELNGAFLHQMKAQYDHEFEKICVLSGHGNTGYGRANNLAIMDSRSDFHLVLNPDVILAQDNIFMAIGYMRAHSDIGLLAPDAEGTDGRRQYIAKRIPSFFVLFARAIHWPPLIRVFNQKLYYYEYRDLIPAAEPLEIELASGCYMLMCRKTAQKIGGFDPDFFMYFEDFNLSQRMRLFKRVIHHPQVKIVHHGGGVATKGEGHIRFFLVSYLRFVLKSIF